MEEEIVEAAGRPDADHQEGGFLPDRQPGEQLERAGEGCEKSEEDALGNDPALVGEVGAHGVN